MAYCQFTTGWSKVHLPNNTGVKVQFDLSTWDEESEWYRVDAVRFFKGEDEYDYSFDPEDEFQVYVRLDLRKLRNFSGYHWTSGNWKRLGDLESDAAVDIWFQILNQDWILVNQSIMDQLWSIEL